MNLIGTSWSCQRCGAAFISTPPEHGLCGQCLADLEALAERRPAWIRPRWDRQSDVWRAWLSAASKESPRGLERLQWWGLQMLAAEVRRQSD